MQTLTQALSPVPALASTTLDDKYTSSTGRIYLSGIQALVRLMLVQRWRDQAAGLNTAGFVSGYRGSPLGGLDEALWKAQPQLEANAVKFLPGVNEELAATAVWGTQQVHLTGESTVDGVFALWYGKAPGVDRCGDVFKHMSHAGTSPRGGVLLVAGDDHGAYSSTLPNQSEHLFAADDPDALSAERGGVHRAWSARLCDVALCGAAGGFQGAGGYGGVIRLYLGRRPP